MKCLLVMMYRGCIRYLLQDSNGERFVLYETGHLVNIDGVSESEQREQYTRMGWNVQTAPQGR